MAKHSYLVFRSSFDTSRFARHSGLDAIQKIRAGIPIDILKSAGDFFEVPDKRIYSVMRIPVTTA